MVLVGLGSEEGGSRIFAATAVDVSCGSGRHFVFFERGSNWARFPERQTAPLAPPRNTTACRPYLRTTTTWRLC